MENIEFGKVHLKNRAYYYVDHIIKLEDFDLANIIRNVKPYKNILIYDISYKNFIVPKHLRVRFDKIDGFIRIYDGTRYLTLFGFESFDDLFKKIRYKSKKHYYIYFFSLFCVNQSWFL